MSNGVAVVDMKSAFSLFIRMRCALSDLSWQVNQAHSFIIEYMEGQGLVSTGQKYSAYHILDSRSCDVEIGIITSISVEGTDGISSGSIPACKAVEARYIGGYIPVVVTYNFLVQWMEENGYEKIGPHYELYECERFDPSDSAMTTRIMIPVQKAGT